MTPTQRLDAPLHAQDGQWLHTSHWPAQDARAVLILLHGMAEHILRYEGFAQRLAARGIAVLGIDLRGHGRTAQYSGRRGIFAARRGVRLVLSDIALLCDQAQALYPGVPLALFGHSMGSLFAQLAAQRFGARFICMMLSGVPATNACKRALGPALAGFFSTLRGREKPNRFLDSMVFGSYEESFRLRRGKFEWLTNDLEAVKAYRADEYCGFVCAGALFEDLARMQRDVYKKSNLCKTPLDLPILLCSGAKDPVTAYGRGTRRLLKRYKALGYNTVAVLYGNCKHEVLNDELRAEMTTDILDFITQHLSERTVKTQPI